MDERQLAARLISYDTSTAEGLHRASEFVKAWLETNDIAVDEREHSGLPVLLAEVGPADGPSVMDRASASITSTSWAEDGANRVRPGTRLSRAMSRIPCASS